VTGIGRTSASLERKRIEPVSPASISRRSFMNRNVTISIGGLILLVVIVAIIF
jgi:hypothetical protein